LFLRQNFDHSKENVKKFKRMSKEIGCKKSIDDDETDGAKQRVKYNP